MLKRSNVRAVVRMLSWSALAVLPLSVACGSDGTGPDENGGNGGPSTTPVEIRTTRLPPGLEGGSYDVVLDATGGDGTDHVWALREGALPPGLSLTSDGRIRGSPTEAGEAEFTVAASSGGEEDSRSLTLAVVPHDESQFKVTLIELTTIHSSVRGHLVESVERWEAAITGDLPSATFESRFFDSNQCGGNGDLLNGTTVDDIAMLVVIDSIDGRAGVIGRAGPCATRGDDGPPIAGSLTLDTYDLLPIVGDPALTALMMHEIGHILGFGVVWDDFIEDSGGSDPRFTGSDAIAAWEDLGGNGAVPVSNQGGQGTRESHWRESVFGPELMTGFAEPPGTVQPMSTVTIASMADIGYDVDLSAADPFSLSPSAPTAPATAPPPGALEGYEVILRGPITVLHPDGRIERRRLPGRR